MAFKCQAGPPLILSEISEGHEVLSYFVLFDVVYF